MRAVVFSGGGVRRGEYASGGAQNVAGLAEFAKKLPHVIRSEPINVDLRLSRLGLLPDGAYTTSLVDSNCGAYSSQYTRWSQTSGAVVRTIRKDKNLNSNWQICSLPVKITPHGTLRFLQGRTRSIWCIIRTHTYKRGS